MTNGRLTIVVWFSCGAASAVALQMTLKTYSRVANIRAVNNPIKEEHPDNRRFFQDVEKWLNIKIETAINDRYQSCSCKDVWDSTGFMSSIHGAKCTTELKKKARQQWESKNDFDYLVLGFTAEEKMRSDNFRKFERSNLLPVLIDEGLTKRDCITIIQRAGIALPAMYGLGYPNANCIGCVKASSPTYWNHVRRVHPEVFEDRARQSRDIGSKLVRVKGKRIFLDELDPNAKGYSMKNMDFECGIFCEE